MTLINQNDPANDNLFRHLQGNILKAHGREHTANIFINCDKNRQASVKEWLKSLAETGIITSTKKQLEDTAQFKATGIDGGMFATILISAKGYEYLGIHTDGKFNRDFRGGMKEADLNDPDTDEWEYGFRGDIHFLLIVADDDKGKVFTAAELFKMQIEVFGSVATVEYGNALRNADNAGIENFGYVDGTSQPLFFEDEIQRYKADNFIAGDDFIYNPSADKTLVLVADPLATGAADAFGSYFVFRKLAQNVRGFKQAEEELAQSLNLQGEDAERAGAMLIGRFENGTPVELNGEAFDASEKPWLRNDFEYQTHDNSKCPYHGHTRKSNPRSGNPQENLAGTQSRVMARRGILFGVRTPGEANDGFIDNKPIGGVGLLFMSYQASLSNQFEFIQKQWVNRRKFPFDDSGIDPIIGQHGGGNLATGELAVEWGQINTLQRKSFEHFVTLKGGEYFFAPSIPFLQGLA